jgi:hypothetical protein
MKTLITILIASFATILFGQSTGGTVDISITTKEKNVGYHPKHVLAIWVEDDTENFVKTLKIRADKRKQYLYTWNGASGGNATDAITGATINSHGTHDVSWDCTNKTGEVVVDGSYTLFIEYTSEHSQGPLTSVELTKAADIFSIQPVDVTYFTDMDISYTPDENTGIEDKLADFSFNVYPVPVNDFLYIDTFLPKEQQITLKLYSVDMKILKVLQNGTMPAGEHTMQMNFITESIGPGVYFLVLTGENRFSSRQIILK